VGRSKTTPGADIIVPIQLDGGSSRYILGKSNAVFGCKVDNGHFPLRQGPDSVRPNSTDDFDGFVQAFEYQMYGSEITEEDNFQLSIRHGSSKGRIPLLKLTRF